MGRKQNKAKQNSQENRTTAKVLALETSPRPSDLAIARAGEDRLEL